jgi:hypothetical protein
MFSAAGLITLNIHAAGKNCHPDSHLSHYGQWGGLWQFCGIYISSATPGGSKNNFA